jgi:TATA-box binding protein (TBP) (component of TFIID and TFIIIB)
MKHSILKTLYQVIFKLTGLLSWSTFALLALSDAADKAHADTLPERPNYIQSVLILDQGSRTRQQSPIDNNYLNTRLKWPKCGGSICDAIEKGKNDITGKRELEAAAKEASMALVERNAAEAQLVELQNRIIQTKAASDIELNKLRLRKQQSAQATMRYMSQLGNFVEQQAALEQLAASAGLNLNSIKNICSTIQIETQTSLSKLKPILEKHTFNDSQKSATITLALRLLKATASSTNQNSNPITIAIIKSIRDFHSAENFIAKSLMSQTELLDRMANSYFNDDLNTNLQNLERMIADQTAFFDAMKKSNLTLTANAAKFLN